MKQGGLLTISAVSGYLYYPTAKIAMLLGLALMITILIILTFRVEKAIKREFKSTK
jgi:F0F1-type ATP synthase membrane subunit a